LSLTAEKMLKLQCIDPHVVVDALAYVIGSEEKEFCTPCIVALAVVLKTAVSVLGSKEKVGFRCQRFVTVSVLISVFYSYCCYLCLLVVF